VAMDSAVGWTLVVSTLTLAMGILMTTGRWRSPLLKAYPGAGVGLTFISLAFIVGATAAVLAPYWAVTMPMMGLAGVLVAAGFIIGSFAPKRLLPRWQREELEKESNGG